MSEATRRHLRGIGAALTALLLVACGGESAGSDSYILLDAPPIAAPAWPSPAQPLRSSCQPALAEWALPALPSDEAGLKLTPSARAHPVGEIETVRVEALTADDQLDQGANGDWSLTLGDEVELVDKTPMVDGVAVAKLKLLSPGVHTVSAKGAGGRSASLSLYGFVPRLPVWRLQTDEQALVAMVNEPLKRIWIDATLKIGAKAYTGKMRLHGGSSRVFPKKSFRLNLNHPPGDGLTDRVILRAEYGDKTMLRNHLSAQLFSAGTWLPMFRTRYVNLRVNDRAYGLMVHTERVDKDFLTDRGLSASGSLYEADPPFEKSVPGANLTKSAAADYSELYQHHAGDLNYSDLIELIEEVLLLPSVTLDQDLNKVIRVDDFLVYLAAQAMIQNQDFVKKNYYLYRDPQAEDPRWTVLPWDLDLSWGHLWTPEGDVLDEQIFTDGTPYVGRDTGTLFFNQLIERLFESPERRLRYLSFVERLLTNTFTSEWVNSHIDDTACRVQLAWLADPNKRASDDEMALRLTELKDYTKARRAWLLQWLKESKENP